MESILSFRDVLRRNNYMVKIDLKGAYLTVLVYPSHRRFLWFVWKGGWYQFKPFWSINCSENLHKTCTASSSKASGTGSMLGHLPGWFPADGKFSWKLRVHTQILVDLLQELGSMLNTKKWFLEPSQIVEFLGCVVNSRLVTILLPEENMEKVKKECHHLLNKPRASGRVLAHLIDLLTSTTPVILPAQLHYRGLQRQTLSQSQSYNLEIELDEDTTKDLHFWICQIHLWNGRPITTPTAEVTITLPVGCQFWNLETVDTFRTSDHINMLELRVAYLALQMYATCLKHTLLLINNQTDIATSITKEVHGQSSSQTWL